MRPPGGKLNREFRGPPRSGRRAAAPRPPRRRAPAAVPPRSGRPAAGAPAGRRRGPATFRRRARRG